MRQIKVGKKKKTTTYYAMIKVSFRCSNRRRLQPAKAIN